MWGSACSGALCKLRQRPSCRRAAEGAWSGNSISVIASATGAIVTRLHLPGPGAEHWAHTIALDETIFTARSTEQQPARIATSQSRMPVR